MTQFGLDDYEPMGYAVLIRVDAKVATESGIILQKAKAEKFMEVIKIGSLVSAIDVGDYILMDQPTAGMIQLKFGNVQYLQIDERNIGGKIPLGKVKTSDIIGL